ncbi:hypothetical protein [Dyella sp. A6]|uniref:hypothetical protein n=1 Tax=Dyella aluminiiresistens TaxID=3069105 RepID=UPI002E7A37B9|nr:hypothetical protein [Dyella sp. A6]
MELKHVANPIEEAGATEQVLSNLFYGWGYNFYRRENQLRADDLLIRGKLSDLLGESRAHLAALEATFRREHLPPPSREHPFPNPSAVTQAQALHRLQQDIEQFETTVRTAAVPEMDRIHQRHRDEAGTLQALVSIDGAMVQAVLSLRSAISGIADAAAATAEVPELLRQSGFKDLWERRQAALSAIGE